MHSHRILFLQRILCLAAVLLTGAHGIHAASDTWQGAYHFPHGSTGPIAARNGVAYLLNGWTRGDGILCFDARKPDAIHFAQGVAGLGYLTGAAFKGEVMYVTSKFSLMVLDVSRPENPRLIRNLLMGFPKMGAMTMAIADNHLFLGGMGCGLRIFDISEPSSPVLVGNNPEYGNVTGLSAAGDLLCITSRGQDAVVATIDGDKIIARSRVKIRGGQLVGPSLYCATQQKIEIYDLSDPTNPVVAGELPAGKILGKLADDRLLVSTKDNGLIVFDTSTPCKPTVKRQIKLPTDLVMGYATTCNNQLFVIDSSRISLRTFDISGAEAMEHTEIHILRNESQFEMSSLKGQALQFWFSYTQRGGVMRVLTANAGAYGEIDFTSCLALPKVEKGASYGFNDVYQACASKRIGHYLLTGDGLLDIADPLLPRALQPPTRMAVSIRTENGKAFLAQRDRVTILDVSRLPELPVLGTYQPEDEDTHITDAIPDKNVLYLINRMSKQTWVEVLDISDPTKPKRIATCEVPTAITATLYRNYLFVPICQPDAQNRGMNIVDISTPGKPTLVKSVPGLVTTACYMIQVHGDAIFFTDSMRGMKRADLSDPLNPVLTNTYTGPTDVGSAYTDFEILAGKLYGLRHSRIDVWQLNEKED